MPDLLKRFTLTPIEHTLDLHGATVKLATNSQILADRLLSVLPCRKAEPSPTPDFVWRVVVEGYSDFEGPETTPVGHRVSHDGLAFVTIGEKSFLASDLHSREGVSFISDTIASNEKLFHQYFLPGFIALVKESLESPVLALHRKPDNSGGQQNW